MGTPKIRARVIDKGEIVIIITEFNQKAIIPKDKLCELAARFNLIYENIEISCPEIKIEIIEEE